MCVIAHTVMFRCNSDDLKMSQSDRAQMDLDLCCRCGSLRNEPGGLRGYKVPAEETNCVRRNGRETHQGTCQGQVDFCLEKAVGV